MAKGMRKKTSSQTYGTMMTSRPTKASRRRATSGLPARVAADAAAWLTVVSVIAQPLLRQHHAGIRRERNPGAVVPGERILGGALGIDQAGADDAAVVEPDVIERHIAE